MRQYFVFLFFRFCFLNYRRFFIFRLVGSVRTLKRLLNWTSCQVVHKWHLSLREWSQMIWGGPYKTSVISRYKFKEFKSTKNVVRDVADSQKICVEVIFFRSRRNCNEIIEIVVVSLVTASPLKFNAENRNVG